MKIDFFEMRGVAKFQGRPWIPLRRVSEERIDAPAPGVLWGCEWIGVGTVAALESDRKKVENLGWTDIGVDSHRAVIEKGDYQQADIFFGWGENPLGINLVIDQYIEGEDRHIWHLHPDLQIALDLLREGDVWYRPGEGWVEAARILYDAAGEPMRLEMKAELLADYLAARGMALYLSSYRERTVLFEKNPPFSLPAAGMVGSGRDQREIKEVESWDDPDGATRVLGALWRTEWFEPGMLSTRVRGDAYPHPISFANDASGKRATPAELQAATSWLYFAPTLVPALMRHRGATLKWHSRDTGIVGATGEGIHFGINDEGLINIFAKDIGRLDAWQQRVWVAHNVTPEGGVSRELFAAQMEVSPASTVAPENRLEQTIKALEEAFAARTGERMLRYHEQVGSLLRRANRFHASGSDGVLPLAKDLSHLFVERLDVDSLAKAAGASERLKSLKSLERYVASLSSEAAAKTLMSPLFGIQDLRGADAHLGTSLVASGLKRAGVDAGVPLPTQGYQVLESFVSTLEKIRSLIVKA